MKEDPQAGMGAGITPFLGPLAMLAQAWQMQSAAAMFTQQPNMNMNVPGFPMHPGLPNTTVPTAPTNLNAHHAPEATQTTTADNDLLYPDVADWIQYCDRHPKRLKARLGDLGVVLAREGFDSLDQLGKKHVADSDLARSLGIGLGRAARITTFAEEDIALLRAGQFDMNSMP